MHVLTTSFQILKAELTFLTHEHAGRQHQSGRVSNPESGINVFNMKNPFLTEVPAFTFQILKAELTFLTKCHLACGRGPNLVSNPESGINIFNKSSSRMAATLKQVSNPESGINIFNTMAAPHQNTNVPWVSNPESGINIFNMSHLIC